MFHSYIISDVTGRNVVNYTSTSCFQHGIKRPASKEVIEIETDAGVSSATTVNAVGTCVLQSAEVGMLCL